MDVKWTSEQKKVIDLRDRDILVSAAAGSGKTAVLVERIVNRICVDNPPVDIDRMLVVTFTKAAVDTGSQCAHHYNRFVLSVCGAE